MGLSYHTRHRASSHGLSVTAAARLGPYEHPERIKTYARFFESRVLKEMTPSPDATGGVCLKVPAATHYVIYKGDTTAIEMDRSKMTGERQAVTVDAKKPYRELRLGRLAAERISEEDL